MNLVVYFLLDQSASMTGPKLETLKEGYAQCCSTVRMVFPKATILVSTLTFDSAIRIVQRQVRLEDCSLPTLRAQGSSALGKAFRQVADWSREDGATAGRLSLVLSDGLATDDWVSGGDACNGAGLVQIGIDCGSERRLHEVFHLSAVTSLSARHTERSLDALLLDYEAQLGQHAI